MCQIIDQLLTAFIQIILSMDSQEVPSLIQEGQQLFSSEYEISPECKQSNQVKLFSSPIHVAQFMQMPKQQSCSPELFVEFTDSFRRIMEKDNEESSENEQIMDIMGNRICEFDPKDSEEMPVPYSPIEEDKQNQIPSSYLNTPLKIRRIDVRSPLQDITPSMTHKKKKTNTKLTVSEKNKLLTPRTMEKSGLASSGLRRLERF